MKKAIIPILLIVGAVCVFAYTLYTKTQETAVVQSAEVHLGVELGATNPYNCYVKAKAPNNTYINGYMETSYCYSMVPGKTRVMPDGWSNYLKIA